METRCSSRSVGSKVSDFNELTRILTIVAAMHRLIEVFTVISLVDRQHC